MRVRFSTHGVIDILISGMCEEGMEAGRVTTLDVKLQIVVLQI